METKNDRTWLFCANFDDLQEVNSVKLVPGIKCAGSMEGVQQSQILFQDECRKYPGRKKAEVVCIRIG